MPEIDESVINFKLFEDSVNYLGFAKVTLPDLSFLVQTISGAGIGGNVETVIPGMIDTMGMSLNYRTTTEQTIRLSEPRRHNLELRAAQQGEDTASGTLITHSIKHVIVAIPKKDSGGTLAPAAPSDGSGDYSVRYWATYIDNKKVREIDPLNNICYINGTDYLAAVRTALGD